MDAGFFLVPAANAVSKGILLLISILVRKLNSYRDICSLHKTFLNKAPESKDDICVSNKVNPPLFKSYNIICALQNFVKQVCLDVILCM